MLPLRLYFLIIRLLVEFTPVILMHENRYIISVGKMLTINEFYIFFAILYYIIRGFLGDISRK